MKCEMKSNFKGVINDVIIGDEQSYDYLKKIY